MATHDQAPPPPPCPAPACVQEAARRVQAKYASVAEGSFLETKKNTYGEAENMFCPEACFPW